MKVEKTVKVKIEELKNLRQTLKDVSAQGIIKYSFDHFGVGNIALASSMSAEDQVLTDMILKHSSNAAIFTIDTGRLPQETYDVIDRTRKKYGIKIEILFPEASSIERMVNEHGPNLFYNSVSLRQECCYFRKVAPLGKRLSGLDAWFCGIRRSQSITRVDMSPVEWDYKFKLFKISPLLEWDEKQVWDYIKKNDIPYNTLHDKGYPSIGCAPCTRAIKPGQELRSGRWWWEPAEQKECGLHK